MATHVALLRAVNVGGVRWRWRSSASWRPAWVGPASPRTSTAATCGSRRTSAPRRRASGSRPRWRSATAARSRERLGDIAPEECILDGREAFLHYPNGVGESKLTAARLERALGVRITVRGIRTVAGLVERS